MKLFEGKFNTYCTILVIASIVGFGVYLGLRCRESIKALFKKSENYQFFDLSIASGVLLLGGMVHSLYTITPLQFVAYAALIAAMLLKVLDLNKESQDKPLLWLSFAYIVSFSMAVPVVYHVEFKNHFLYHGAQMGASIALVVLFTFLLIKLFQDKEDLFNPFALPILLAADLTLIIWRWQYYVNVFLFVFVILTTLIFIGGFTYKLVKKFKK